MLGLCPPQIWCSLVHPTERTSADKIPPPKKGPEKNHQ